MIISRKRYRRWAYRCNWRQMGTRIWAFDWYQFWWTDLELEMGIEPNPNRTRTHVEKTYIELEPNRTHHCDEPEPNPNLLTQVLVGFDKFVD